MTTPRRLLLAASLLTSGISFVAAQTALPAGAPVEQEATKLSPFIVNDTQDSGYGAHSTLAGTRLNTPLADLAASISVYTKAFLNDTGATDQNFLIYATGMEAGGQFGNYSGAITDINAVETVSFGPRADTQSSTRTRGLSAPNFTRGFFTTNVTMDSYNVDRVTVARGPNAILFGVGSPAGVIDTTLLQPDVSKNRNSVSTRYGNNDSGRVSVDLNRVLIPNKLAIRLAGLKDNDKFNQRPAFEDKERIYGAATWRPFKSSSIRANFESGRTTANRPDTVLPFNNISPQWLAAGRPTYDWSFYDDPAKNPNAASQAANASAGVPFGPGFFIGNTPGIGDQVGIFYSNPNDKVPAYGFRTNINSTNANQANVIKNQLFNSLVNRDSAPDTIKMYGTLDVSEFAANYWTAATVLPGQQPGFVPAGLKRQGFTDYSAFDFNDEMLDTSARQYENFHTFDIAFEQRAWDDRIGIELAYNAQRDDKRARISFLGVGGDSYVRVDPNVYLPNGQLNPNLGRPYLNSGNTRLTNVFTERSNLQATAYLKYDFKDISPNWGKWLGHHTLTGVGENALLDTVGYNPQLRMDGPVAQGINPAINSSQRVPVIVAYVGPSLVGNANPLRLQQLNIPAPVAGPNIPVTTFVRAGDDVDPGSFQSMPNSLTSFINAGSVSRELIRSTAVNLQSYWLKDYFITLLGWRRDTDYFISRPVNYVANPANPDDPGQVNFGFNDLHFPHTPPRKDGKDIKTYSLLLRLPTQYIGVPRNVLASVFYNNSENFTPSGSRVDGYGVPLPSPKGATKEYGFDVSALDNKLSLRVTWFKTAVQGQSFNPAVFGAVAPATVGFVSSWTTEVNLNPQLAAQRAADIKLLTSALPANFLSLYGFSTSGTAPNVAASYNTNIAGAVDTTDFSAHGTEFELTISPTSNWRIMANIARQETIQTNELPWLKKLIATMTPVWKQLGAEAAGHYNTGWNPGDPLGVTNVSTYIDQNVTVPFATAVASEGSASPEQRKWRANLVTNYTFGHGSLFEGLKGFGVGGALRWQDKLGLGYPTTRNVDGTVNFDLKHPYYAPPQTNVDAWVSYTRKIFRGSTNWKAQLNFNNLIGQNGPIGYSVQPNGQIAGARLPPERRWYLTNSFDF